MHELLLLLLLLLVWSVAALEGTCMQACGYNCAAAGAVAAGAGLMCVAFTPNSCLDLALGTCDNGMLRHSAVPVQKAAASLLHTHCSAVLADTLHSQEHTF
jgi:hypothetical protein